MADTDRPQDVGRRHRRRAAPSPATATLLDRYRESMRDELAGLLDELAPQPGLLPDAPGNRPELTMRARLWDLAIKIGRELGTEIAPPADPAPMPTASRAPRRSRIPYE